MSKRESGSVVLAFAGFGVLVLAFRGVWGNAWQALLGHKGAATGSGAAASVQQAGLAYPVSPGTLAYAGVTSGRPGQAPTPQTIVQAQSRAAPVQQHPLLSSARGDRAGAPGENRFTFASPGENTLWAFHGGWQGPGVYEAQKFSDPGAGMTSGTELVRVG